MLIRSVTFTIAIVLHVSPATNSLDYCVDFTRCVHFPKLLSLAGDIKGRFRQGCLRTKAAGGRSKGSGIYWAIM